MFRSKILIGFAILACLFALFDSSKADFCFSSAPPVKKGGACGESAYCVAETYCDKTGTCVAQKESGQPCENDNECFAGTNCQGPENQQVCVSYSNPGETCDNDDSTVVGYCGSGLSCDIPGEATIGTCLEGKLGDGCGSTAHCSGNLTCVSGTCTPVLDGQICVNSESCKPGSYCFNEICRPLETEGTVCGNNGKQCAKDFDCIGLAFGDSTECVKWRSRKVGEFCTEDAHCAGANRCYNNKCAKKNVEYCSNNANCGDGESCLCDGTYLEDGYGKCGSSPCAKRSQKYEDCFYKYCKDGNGDNYSNSCVRRNCGDEIDALRTCY